MLHAVEAVLAKYIAVIVFKFVCFMCKFKLTVKLNFGIPYLLHVWFLYISQLTPSLLGFNRIICCLLNVTHVVSSYSSVGSHTM